MKYLLLTHLAATLFMVGVIWFDQVVHYPLFDKVGAKKKLALYSKALPPDGLCRGSTDARRDRDGAPSRLSQPEGVPLAALVGLVLVALNWTAISLLQVPRHTTIGSGFDEGAHKGLVFSNRVRTAAPARGGLVL